MDCPQSEKVTLIQLQRFLPLKPPTCPNRLPQTVERYLGSPTFNNLSLKDQRKAKKQYQLAYRSYYQPNSIVQHLQQITNKKFSNQSILQALDNSAMKFGRVDWYRFVLIVTDRLPLKKIEGKEQAARIVQRKLRQHLVKKKIDQAYQEVNNLRQSVEQKLKLELQRQCLKELKQHVERNRIKCEEVLNKIEQKEMNFIEFERTIQGLEGGLQKKKIQYLFMKFENKRRKAEIEALITELLPQRKAVSVEGPAQYLKPGEQLFTFVRSYMVQLYYSWQDMCEQYKTNYHDGTDQIKISGLYNFLRDKCQDKISWIQAIQIKNSLQTLDNIKYLYQRANVAQLTLQVARFIEKKARKAKLHVENEVFYSFRTIILLLVSRCKSDKMKRENFNKFTMSYDNTLKNDAFYAVWRVFGNLINVRRIKQECGVSPLACHLILTHSSQKYQTMVEQLIDALPANTEVPYSKVEQRINLNLQFILDNFQSRPLPLGDNDFIDYRTAIKKIFPLDFDILIRSYIFKKVAQKIIVLWRSAREKKLREKKVNEALLGLMAIPQDKKRKKSLESKVDRGGKKLLTSSSNKQASKPKNSTEVNPEHSSLVKDILNELLNSLDPKDQQNDEEFLAFKKEVTLPNSELYTFRANITRIDFHWLLGAVAFSRQFLTMKGGHLNSLKLKLPYRPGISPVDFAIWGNNLVVLTTLYSLQLYTLGQAQSYPQRTIQLAKQQLSQKFFDSITRERLHRQLPCLLKPQGQKLLVNVLYSNQLMMIDEDPTVPCSGIKLDFQQHFFNRSTSKIIQYVNKMSPQQKIDFIEQTIQGLSDEQERKNILPQYKNSPEIKITNFEWRKWWQWLEELGYAARSVLQWELKVNKKVIVSFQVGNMLKAIRTYMTEYNLSVNEVLHDIGCPDGILNAKSVKKYLSKVVGLDNLGSSDGWMHQLGLGKQIQYNQLANIIAHEWKYSPLQQPYLIVTSFFMVPNLPILVYTLQNFPHIFMRNTETNKIIAVLVGHTKTPLIQFIPEQFLIVSTEAQKQKGKGEQLYIWRIFEDILGKYSEHPPWKIDPLIKIKTGHEAAISSIAYSARCNSIITASLDGSLKFWEMKSNTFVQIKRIYAEDSHYLHVATNTNMVGNGQVPVEVMVSLRIGQQISLSNAYPFDTTVQIKFIEPMIAKIAGKLESLPTPLRLIQKMGEEGSRRGAKKKALIGRWQREQMEKIGQGLLALRSLDLNFYAALKAAFIFSNKKQLEKLVKFINNKKYAQMVIRKVCEEYGLDLLHDLPFTALDNVPLLPVPVSNSVMFQQIELYEDAYRDVMDQLSAKATKSGLIDEDIVLQVVGPHLYGDLEEKFKQLLGRLPQSSTLNFASTPSVQKKSGTVLHQLSELKKIINVIPLEGAQEKLYSALRILQRLLKKTKTPLWQLFSSSLGQLDKSKRIRTPEFIQKVKNIGLTEGNIEAITNYLSHSNSISLFQLLHYARVAVQVANPSQLLANYSSIILAQSVIMDQSKTIRESIQKDQIGSKQPEKSLHTQVKEMLKNRSGKLSESDSLRSSQLKKEDEEAAQLRQSNSQTSLSSRGKDELQKKANIIINKLRELLRNEGKSLWDIISVACSSFVREPILSESQYFAIFEGLRTPLRLVDKLDLLKYLKREGDGRCSLNIFFDIMEPQGKRKIQGQKYLLLHLLDTLETNYSNILEQALEMSFFSQNQQISAEQFLNKVSEPPFDCAQFGVNQWELILKQEKLPNVGSQQLQTLFYSFVDKHRLNIEFNKLGFTRALLNLIEQKNLILTKLFPKTSNADYEYFKNCTEILHQAHIDEDFKSLAYSLGEGKHGLQARLQWDQLIKELEKRIKKARQQQSLEAEAVRRLAKGLQSRRMSPFEFFVSMDRNHNFFITQEQLQAGLVELEVSYDLWPDIPKRFSKRLSYYSFLSYLIKKRVFAYKSVDSHLETAMQRFQRRFLRQGDLQASFHRIAGNSVEVEYKQFLEAVQRVQISQQHAKLLFGLLVNNKVVWGRRWGNDQVLNDPSNLNRTFNFKRFAEVMLKFRTDNLTKSVAFRFYEYFKKRNISLVFQFRKWLDANRKIKEVGEAIKKNSFVLPNEVFMMFLNYLHTGFSEQQLKDLIQNKNSLQVDFHNLVSYLEDTYKRAHSKIGQQEVETYLQMIVTKMDQMKVGLPRVLKDFADKKGRLGLGELTSLTQWLGVGLTKIQLRKIVTVLDTQKEGKFKMNSLAEAVEQASQKMQRDDEDFRFDYIIQKLMNNSNKYVLKASKLAFTSQRAIIIFQNLLTSDQCELLVSEAKKELKKQNMTEKEMLQYLDKKVAEMKKRTNKKDKETALKILNMISRMGLDIDTTFSYIARHSPKEVLNKQQFLLLYQSFELKIDLNQLTSLFSFFEEKPGTGINRSKWEEKLSMVKMEFQQQLQGSVEQLKLFYKVKVYLAQVYLLFVRKAFKSTQIYHYFDKHSTGVISPDELMFSLHQLGVPPEEDLVPKLMNYLDKNRDNHLSVKLILNELENCIGSKMRMILSTRTSLLFREKSKLFAQQSQKFINELASREQLTIQNNGDSFNSTISEAAFINLLNQFGCRLKDDEVQDIRRNFQTKQGQLSLYPIYQSFMNLFQGSLQLPTDQIELYRRLMGALVSKNFTLANVIQASTLKELSSFIDQLGIFTPIEVKLIVEANLYEGSKAVDHDLLKKRLRDAHLTQEDEMLTSSLFQLAESPLQSVQKQLIQTIDPMMWKQMAGLRHRKITLDQFEECLWQSGVWVTKGIAKKYFTSFAEGDFLDMSKLLKICQKNKLKTEMDWQIEQSECEDEAILQKRQEAVKHLQQRGSIRIAEHLIKSINFKDVALEDELNQYFINNYGFVSYSNFMDFLAKTGLDLKTYEKDIRQFQDEYCFTHLHQIFDPKDPPVLEVKLLQKTLTIAKDICRTTHNQERTNEKVECVQLEEWRSNQEDMSEKLSEWLVERGIGQFKHEHIYRYLFEKYPQQRQLLHLLIRNIPKYVATFKQFCQWFHNPDLPNLTLDSPRKTSEAGSPYSRSQILKRQQNPQYLRQLLRRDPVETYKLAIKQFTSIDIPQPNSNLGRLAICLFLRFLIKYKHLLQLKPLLIVPEVQPKPQPLELTHAPFNYNVKAMASLIIEEQSPLDENGLLIANKKWLAFPLERKYEFEAMATVAHLLHPSSLFIRSKNLYLWEPTMPQLPKNALSYRWNLIPVLTRKILEQMATVHCAGYCLPHLRWKNLGQASLIDCPVYPCPIDKDGVIKLKVGFSTLNFEDPYCPPQFYNVYYEDNLNAKCDSWIFGCILYELIYGHKPLSFLSQLQSYILERQPGFSLSQVLAMQHLPAQFNYTFFDSHKLNRLFALEHYMNPRDQKLNFEQLIRREQSMGAILFPLQVLYQQELQFYKPQFQVMSELNTIIWECLAVKPAQRPTIEQLLTKPVFAQQQPLTQYVETLAKHPNAIQFYEDCIQPFFDSIAKGTNIANSCLQCLQNILQRQQYLISSRKIQGKLVIPKQYLWPVKAEGSFTGQLLANKQLIRQSSNFNLVTLLFQSRFLEYSLLVSLSQPEVANQVLTILSFLAPSLKDYESPCSAFVPHILDYLLRILYQSPTEFISEHRHILQSDTEIAKWAIQAVQTIKKRQYFRVKRFEGVQAVRCLALIKELVLLTGEGNSVYLPVFHYLEECYQVKLLFQVIFNHISLSKGQHELNIQYFIDTLNDQQKMKHQAKCRIQVFMMTFLTGRGQIKRLALTYFKDCLYLNSQILKIYQYPSFFLQLAAMLRDPVEQLTNKHIILDILSFCLDNHAFKILKGSSANLLQQATRLMIEPPRNASAHQEYEQLRPQLKELASTISQNRSFLRELQMENEAISSILQSLLSSQDNELELRSYPMLRSEVI